MASSTLIGSKISLVSNANIRYEGVLYTIDPVAATVALENVRSFGTENRVPPEMGIPPSDDVYPFIIFSGNDIKDLIVSEAAVAPTPAARMLFAAAFPFFFFFFFFFCCDTHVVSACLIRALLYRFLPLLLWWSRSRLPGSGDCVVRPAEAIAGKQQWR